MNNFDDCLRALENKLKSYDDNFNIQKADYPIKGRDYMIMHRMYFGGEYLFNEMVVEIGADKPEKAQMYINEQYRDKGWIDYDLVDRLYEEFLDELKG